MDEEFRRRVDMIRYMVKKKITDHWQIWKLITDYYKEPEITAQRIREELRKIEELESKREGLKW